MAKKIDSYVSEHESWVQIDRKTGKMIGEIKEVDVVLKSTSRSGFMITYISTIIQMIDKLGNQKMQVVKYLLRKIDKTNNMLVKTIADIHKETGISTKTINETLKILEKANIISRKPGLIMISPRLIHKGNYQKEKILMTKFQEIQGFNFKEIGESLDDIIESA